MLPGEFPTALVLGWLAPLFLLFEIGQLVVATRYLGIDKIRQGVHPLIADPRGSGALGCGWLACIMASYLYQAFLLHEPRAALPGLLMLVVSFVGLALRRVAGLKWALVILTFEGALRTGFLVYVFVALVIDPGGRAFPRHPFDLDRAAETLPACARAGYG